MVKNVLLWVALIAVTVIIFVVVTILHLHEGYFPLVNYTSPVESQSIYGGGTTFDSTLYPTGLNVRESELYVASHGLYGPDLSSLELPQAHGRCTSKCTSKCTSSRCCSSR